MNLNENELFEIIYEKGHYKLKIKPYVIDNPENLHLSQLKESLDVLVEYNFSNTVNNVFKIAQLLSNKSKDNQNQKATISN